jgi:hypothetical protein
MVDRNRIAESKVEHFCSHANCNVVLKTTYIYPADIMPDSPPRINQRGCSHYFVCSLQDKSACVYAVENINRPKSKVEASVL